MIQAAISAIVFVNVLVATDGLLDGLQSWFKWAPRKLQNMMFYCAKCQSAWWLVIYCIIGQYTNDQALMAIWMVFDTIFITYIISLIISRWLN